ncbi:MAG TPA: HRDC domain-containing protein [Gemmatimonadaceae bacterium]|nr:HRDC domain-containing protein [Gemmatimonadaceae bacterium]
MGISDAEALLYIDTQQDADNFLDDISGVREIAIDTEGASFHRFIDRIYLLQISTRDCSAIIDPLPIGMPQRLGAILEDPDVEVVFHDADYDLRLLHQDYGWHVNHIFDTRIASQLLGIKAFGLAALLDQFFGVKLDKKHQRADWSLRPLTRGMLDYAAQDTRYLLDLRDELKARLEKLGRWTWAREEFDRLEGTKWGDDDSSMAFLKIKGARDLSRRELALLRELVPWRDSVAKEVDRATFRVMGNEVLLEIARTAPKTVKDLSSLKGMPRGILDRGAIAILSAVQRGLEVADEELPRFPRAPKWEREDDFDSRVAKLKNVRDAAATRLLVDPGVLCSRERLEAVARRKPESLRDLEDIPGLRKWQMDEMGEQFVQVLRN